MSLTIHKFTNSGINYYRQKEVSPQAALPSTGSGSGLNNRLPFTNYQLEFDITIMDIAIPFWILVISYYIHLLTTVIWLGGLTLMAIAAWPALQKGTIAANQWLDLQRRFTPWINLSLALLLVTGFVQMTASPHYEGFLEINSLWSWAILLKHVAFVGMVAITAHVQVKILPAATRLELLAQQKPELAAREQANLHRQEMGLLKLNLFCAGLVLFFTAIATAV